MATTNPVNVKHLDKAELTQFQCVVAVVAYAITESLTKAAMDFFLHQIVIGDDKANIASQMTMIMTTTSFCAIASAFDFDSDSNSNSNSSC